MKKMDPKGHYPPNTNSNCITLNCIQITLHYFQCRISAMPLFRADLVLAILKPGACLLTSPFFFNIRPFWLSNGQGMNICVISIFLKAR